VRAPQQRSHVLRLGLAVLGVAVLALGLPGAAGAQIPDGGVGADVVSLDVWDWLNLTARLGVVLLVIWAAFWGMRWYTQRTQIAGGSRGELEVLETRALGPNRSLQLVRVGRRAVLVGVTADRINQLLQIDDPEEVQGIVQALEAQRSSSPGLGRIAGSLSRISLPSLTARRARRAARATTMDTLGGEDFAPPAAGTQQLQASAAYRQTRIAELQRAIEEARRGTSFESVR
jgi:flagellar biosynthetic protein FliO